MAKWRVPRSNQQWCSDGFEFRCDSDEPLRVTFAPDCCDREAMSGAATTAGHSGDIVRDVMLAAVENRFLQRIAFAVRNRVAERQRFGLYGRRYAPVCRGSRPEAIDHAGVQPPK